MDGQQWMDTMDGQQWMDKQWMDNNGRTTHWGVVRGGATRTAPPTGDHTTGGKIPWCLAPAVSYGRQKFYNQFPVTSVTIPIIHSLASVRRMGQQGYSFGVPWVTCDTPLCEQAAPSTSYVSRKDTG